MELDDLFVAGQFFDRRFQFFAAQRRGIVAHELMKLLGKFRISERLPRISLKELVTPPFWVQAQR